MWDLLTLSLASSWAVCGDSPVMPERTLEKLQSYGKEKTEGV